MTEDRLAPGKPCLNFDYRTYPASHGVRRAPPRVHGWPSPADNSGGTVKPFGGWAIPAVQAAS